MKYWLWRNFCKLTHRFDLHYMPVSGPYEDGRKQAWCQWCGLRDWVYDPGRSLMEIKAAGVIAEAYDETTHGD